MFFRQQLLALAAMVLATAPVADARDTRHKFKISAAMAIAEKSGRMPPGVKFYFGTARHSKVVQSFGPVRTNKKTNFFNKSDQKGCEWAFFSALLALGERARQVGANSVVGIRSNYRHQEFSSETEYECGAGAISGGVAFVGEIVTLP